MKVLFLSTWFPHPPDNGSKIRVYHLLRALGRQHEVTLVSFAFDTARPGAIEAQALGCAAVDAVGRNPFERSQLDHRLRFLSARPIVEAPLQKMTEAAAHHLTTQQFDVVIASTTLMAPYARPAGRAARVLEEHNCWSRWARERYEAAPSAMHRIRLWASWQKRRAYEGRIYRNFHLCTMVSDADRAETLQVLDGAPVRVEVVRNGVDCDRYRPGLLPAQPDTLVYSGALSYSANYDAVHWFLAEVLPKIRMQIPAARLTITGSTQGVDLRGLQLDEAVRLTGYVEDVRVPVAQSSACVIPLRQGGGTRLKILEAMALGTPMVSTRKGAEGLQVLDGEHILLADDAATFAERTVRLLREPALRQRLALNARTLVEERYDWDGIGRRFVELVDEAAARRSAP